MSNKEVLHEMKEPKSLTEMTPRVLSDALKTSDIAILSFGSMENHGVHLPLGADYFQGDALMRRTAEFLTERGLTAVPAFCTQFGVQTNRFERQNAFGNICISQTTFINMVKELTLSLVETGFKRFVFCLNHVENLAALNVAAKDLGDLHNIPVIVANWVPIALKVRSKLLKNKTGQGHAGEPETAAVMAAVPNLVDLSDVGAYHVPEDTNPVAESNLYYFGGGVGIFTPVGEDKSPGFLGDPADATAQTGEKLIDLYANWTADVVCKYWGSGSK